MYWVKRLYPTIIVAAIIFYLSSVPGATLQNTGFDSETYHVNGHFFMYFLLGITLYRATKRPWLAILLAILYGLSDEYHQTFVPGRAAQWWDLFVDTIGATLAQIIIKIYLWKFYLYLPKQLKNWLEL